MKSSTVYDRLLVTYSNHVLIYWDTTITYHYHRSATVSDDRAVFMAFRESCHHFPCHSAGGSTISRERSI